MVFNGSGYLFSLRRSGNIYQGVFPSFSINKSHLTSLYIEVERACGCPWRKKKLVQGDNTKRWIHTLWGIFNWRRRNLWKRIHFPFLSQPILLTGHLCCYERVGAVPCWATFPKHIKRRLSLIGALKKNDATTQRSLKCTFSCTQISDSIARFFRLKTPTNLVRVCSVALAFFWAQAGNFNHKQFQGQSSYGT